MLIKLQILLNFCDNVSWKSTWNRTCWSVRHPVKPDTGCWGHTAVLLVVCDSYTTWLSCLLDVSFFLLPKPFNILHTLLFMLCVSHQLRSVITFGGSLRCCWYLSPCRPRELQNSLIHLLAKWHQRLPNQAFVPLRLVQYLLVVYMPQPSLEQHFVFIVCEWVFIPKTLWTTPYGKNQWKKFHPVLVTDVFEFTDVLIRFRSKWVKGQGHSRQWPEKVDEYDIFITIGADFHQL